MLKKKELHTLCNQRLILITLPLYLLRQGIIANFAHKTKAKYRLAVGIYDKKTLEINNRHTGRSLHSEYATCIYNVYAVQSDLFCGKYVEFRTIYVVGACLEHATRRISV